MKQKIVLLAIVFALGKISLLSFASELDEDLQGDNQGSNLADEIIVDESNTILENDEAVLSVGESMAEEMPEENAILEGALVSGAEDATTLEEEDIVLESQTETLGSRGVTLRTLASEEETTECESHVDEDGDGVCDNCSESIVQEEPAEKSAEEETEPCEEHVDENGDGVCDVCGEEIEEVEIEEETVPTGIEVVVIPFFILFMSSMALLLIFHNRRVADEA